MMDGIRSPKRMLIALAIWRLFLVCVVRTFYVPDEYWQSLEVAHKLSFGYGYLTWEWKEGIRSYFYPAIIAVVYKILGILHLDYVSVLIYAPRVMQALLSAYADYRFYVWNNEWKWSLCLITTSWFWCYMGTRTLSNTLETSLTIIALSYFWDEKSYHYLWYALLCCYVRPTAIVVWAPLLVYALYRERASDWKGLLVKMHKIGAMVGAGCVLTDSLLHGEFVITPIKFFLFNLYYNVSSHYGTHPWYWYIFVGLPVVLGIYLIPFIYGVISTLRNPVKYKYRYTLLRVIVFYIVVMSFLGHKEHRFLTIIIPLALAITTETIVLWSCGRAYKTLNIVLLCFLIGNFVPMLYLGAYYKDAPHVTVTKLRSAIDHYENTWMLKKSGNLHPPVSVMFLLPCHSTPYYSHIHKNITLRFLTCEPNFYEEENYVDEADYFFNSPGQWIYENIQMYPTSAYPTFIVLSSELSAALREFLKFYIRINVIYNNEFNTGRIGKNIYIYQRFLPDKDGWYFNYIDKTYSMVRKKDDFSMESNYPWEN